MTRGKRLVLVRHAEAEQFAATDRDRGLTDRGRRDAEAAGHFLRRYAIEPDLAVVSPAVRARQTWEALAEALTSDTNLRLDGVVYDGSPDMVLETLQIVPEETGTVLLVGHQPSVGQIAHLLEDGTGDPDALHRMLRGFPAGSVAVFHVAVDWDELGPESACLVAFRPGEA